MVEALVKLVKIAKCPSSNKTSCFLILVFSDAKYCSDVWLHFTKVDAELARCLKCNKSFHVRAETQAKCETVSDCASLLSLMSLLPHHVRWQPRAAYTHR